MKKHILLSIFTVLFFAVNAQNLSLNLPFMEDNPQPEIFIMEPHYDSNNQITHYTTGDIVKVEYTKDEQGQAKSKQLYTWDKHDNEWELQSETFFQYDGKRIVEEKTVQPYPHIRGRSTVYMQVNTIVKQSFFDAQTNTDTVKIKINFPALGTYHRGRQEEMIAIRYLNSHNLPDSIVTIQESPISTTYTKEICHYDNKLRKVSSEAYSRNTHSKWEPIYFIKTDYQENKITYTQETFYEPMLLSHNIAPEYDEKEKKKKSSKKRKEVYPKITYSLSFDNQGRISERLLQVGKRTMINSRHSYDEQGHTLTEHIQDIDKEFMSVFGLSDMPISDDLLYLHYTVKWEDNCRHGAYSTKNEKGNVVKRLDIKNCYSPKGGLTYHELTQYEEDGSLDKQKRLEYNYEEEPLMGEKIEYEKFYYRNTDDTENNPRRKTIFRKDEMGRILYEEEQDWSEKDGFTPYRKKISVYDQNGFISHEETHEYNTYKNEWEGKWNSSYIKDDRDRILQEHTRVWEKGKWVDSRIEKFTYNDQNEYGLYEKLRWIPYHNDWVGDVKDSTVYDALGNKTEYIEYRWNSNGKRWDPITRKAFYKEENMCDRKEEEILYQWSDGKWVINHLAFEINECKDETKSKGSSIWNPEKECWEVRYLHKIYFPEGKGQFSEIYVWDDSLKLLAGHEKTCSQINRNDHPDRIRTYSLWDYNKNDWKDTLRVTPIGKDEKEIYVFEVYSFSNNLWQNSLKREREFVKDTLEVITEFVWSSFKWVPSLKRESYYEDKDPDDPAKEIMYSFDSSKNKWIPAYYWYYSTYKKDLAIIYAKWNETNKSWENEYMESGDLPIAIPLYQWNDTQSEWDLIEELDQKYAIKEIIDDRFKMELKVDYKEMIKKNRENFTLQQ